MSSLSFGMFFCKETRILFLYLLSYILVYIFLSIVTLGENEEIEIIFHEEVKYNYIQ